MLLELSARKGLFLFFLVLLINFPTGLRGQSVDYDTITVSRNWRTKNDIVLTELSLPRQGPVDRARLEKAIDRVWNIGNFAQVKYNLDTLKDGRIRLDILARDAFNIVPIVQFNGNLNDYRAGLGLNDHNFLGKNVELYGKYQFGTYQHSGAFRIGLPRQLLYRNLSVGTGMSFGEARMYRYSGDTISSGVGYKDVQFGIDLGNPFHTDDYYTFSPNLSIYYFQHKIDYSYMDIEGLPYYEPSMLRFLRISTGESIGHIYHRRHRRDGYSVGLSYAFGLGLNDESKNYHQFGFAAQLHEKFNNTFQLSATFSNSYTTSNQPSLLNYHGGSTIKGLRTGQISGKTVYSGYLGMHMTYLESQWLAIVHKVFLNTGQGADRLRDLYTIKPFFSVGTGVRIMVPMIPWLYINLYFSYSGKDRDWFFLEF